MLILPKIMKNNIETEIQAYPAGKDVFLLLTGMGGSAFGYADKYVRIAESVREKFGFSVFVAALPEEAWTEKDRLFEEIARRTIAHAETAYVMGVSAGGSLALWYAAGFPQIRRVLCVNPVLRINLHRTLGGIDRFCGERMTVAVGERDPSTVWANVLPARENVHIALLPGVDHVFGGRLDEFIALPEKFLFY